MPKFHCWSNDPEDVKVIAGNNKLGKISNLSLLPCVTCAKDAPCRKKGCYAKKFLWPTVSMAWTHNTKLAKNPKVFFASLRKQFNLKQPKWFRFFVSGDCPSYSFWCQMLQFCTEFPNTKFLIFTKRYGWANQWLGKHTRPENATILFSAWPGYKMENPHDMPVAWMRDEKNLDERIPRNAIECPGTCESCGMCWNLPKIGLDVVFDKH
jgi:hypothetical protein